MSRLGIYLLGVFIVKRHESLNSEEADAKVLEVRSDVLAYNALVDSRTGSVSAFELLKKGAIDDAACSINNTVIESLSGVKNDICQKLRG